jgi:hypothetical protein
MQKSPVLWRKRDKHKAIESIACGHAALFGFDTIANPATRFTCSPFDSRRQPRACNVRHRLACHCLPKIRRFACSARRQYIVTLRGPEIRA